MSSLFFLCFVGEVLGDLAGLTFPAPSPHHNHQRSSLFVCFPKKFNLTHTLCFCLFVQDTMQRGVPCEQTSHLHMSSIWFTDTYPNCLMSATEAPLIFSISTAELMPWDKGGLVFGVLPWAWQPREELVEWTAHKREEIGGRDWSLWPSDYSVS